MNLATIGYEGLNGTKFFDILLSNNIRRLIDIRELPLSRKPGFSKTALKERAGNVGIQYTHLGKLGCPRPIRHAYREDNDWNKYTRHFLEYLRSQDDEIENLLELISVERSCLLCFEADHLRCHRYYVAEAVAQIAEDLKIIHLGATEMPVVWQPSWEGIPIPQ